MAPVDTMENEVFLYLLINQSLDIAECRNKKKMALI